MKIHAVLVAVTLIAAGTLSVSAQRGAVGTTARATVARTVASKVRTDALTTIQGNALTSTNGALNDTVVRLRDARFGRIVDTQLTDKSGLFAFKSIDPGTYIVEVMANNDSVLAASQLLHVDAGQAVSAVVKLPFRIPPFAGIMGTSNTASAAAVATQAAASGIAAIVPTIPISPGQ
jgi:PDZ domain-containing secreted protein